VRTTSEINLGFKTAGQISRILVKEGDYVREGAVVAQLDQKDYLLQLQATQIQYDQLKTEVERLETLYKRNSLPVNDYEKASAGLNALGVQLQAHKNVVEYTTLKSPVSGYIQSVKSARAEMVNAGMTIVTLIDVSSVKVETELPASLFLRMDNFIGYSCRTVLVGEEEIPLKFVGVNRKSNSSQLHKMTFSPASAESRLAPGMNVEVLIRIDEKTAGTAYTLPVKTVFNENGKTYVWIVQNNAVNKREVKTGGVSQNGALVILSGISDSDEVVAAGLRALHENDRVRVIPQATETNVGGLL
ncbi:MAG: efflux RND transporter periplasmic adaptor subunit, partial [Bacteroidales bacterium]|nr:efflux RND transporter periplasmic adaptor subunit [Bacteroidales bacterium]